MDEMDTMDGVHLARLCLAIACLALSATAEPVVFRVPGSAPLVLELREGEVVPTTLRRDGGLPQRLRGVVLVEEVGGLSGKHRQRSLRLASPSLALAAKDLGSAEVALSGLGLSKARSASVHGWFLADAGDGVTAFRQAAALQAKGITAIPVLARLHSLRLLPADPLFPQQWHLRNTGQSGASVGNDLNLTSVWDTFRGAGVTIAIADDGVQLTHPDLAANALPSLDPFGAPQQWDFVSSDSDPSPAAGNTHGTSCAGAALARWGNSIGLSGAAPEASLIGLRLVDGPTSDADEASAFTWRRDLVSVRSNSWGPDDDGATLGSAGPLAAAALHEEAALGRGGLGTLVFWAAGNGRAFGDDSNYDAYANAPEVIAIGALGATNQVTAYGEDGANIAVVAPSSGGGPAIVTTTVTGTGNLGGDYTSSFGGTSAASPLAAGVCALVLQANPSLSSRAVKELLLRTANRTSLLNGDPFSTNAAGLSFSHTFGAGRIDAAAAVAAASGWTNPPPTSIATATSAASVVIPDTDPRGARIDFSITEDLRAETVEFLVSTDHSSRGQLTWILRSPSGMESRVSPRPYDTAAGLTAWRFSTVRHWGESSSGRWRLEAIDLTPGGTGNITGATLRIHGTPRTGLPTITSVSPTTAAPGATLTLSGTGLSSLSTVRIGTLDTAPTSVSPTSLTAVVPVGAAYGSVSARDGAGGAATVAPQWFTPAAPANDTFAARRALTGASGRVLAHLGGASAEPSEPAVQTGTARQTVWFSWTAPATAQVAFGAGLLAPQDNTALPTNTAVLGLYSGNSLAALVSLPGTPEPGIAFPWKVYAVSAGQTYQIAVDTTASGGAAATPFVLEWRPTTLSTLPANDAFADATLLSGRTGTLYGFNTGATAQASEPNPAGTGGARSVWWRWTPPTSGTTTIDTLGSSFDTVLGVYTGSALGSLSLVGSNDDIDTAGGNYRSRVTFNATAGVTYQILVNGWSDIPGSGGETGSITLNWAGPAPSLNSVSPNSALPLSVVTLSGGNLSHVTALSVGGVPAAFTPGAGGTLSLTVPAGATTGPITGNYTIGTETGSLAGPTLTVTPWTYDVWKVLRFTPSEITAGSAAPEVDPDGDGVANLLEYACGTDPKLSEPATEARAFLTDTGYLALRFRRSTVATGVTLTVETAATPAGPWTTTTTQVGSATALAPGVGEVVFRDTVLPIAGSARWMRLAAGQ